MLFTIFTPLYNRSKYLDRIFNSLKNQTIQDFEWIIVDDGSNDAPEAIIEKFIKSDSFSITYHRQNNKGKHFAINKGLDLTKGELFLILDSDDYLPDNALEIIAQFYEEIKNDLTIGGVAGRRNFHDGQITGNEMPKKIISNSIDIRYKHKVTGDLVEVYKTSVLKKYKFPEIEGEKFCPEILVWNRIAKHYKLLFFNQGIYTTEYLEGGLTDKIVKIRMTSPQASMLTYAELYNHNIPIISKMKALLNFWRFSFNSKMNIFKKINHVPAFSIILLPLGYVMFLNDLKNNKS